MAKTKSGTQCGRWVTDGSMPAICHKHKPNAPAVGVIPPDDAIDPVKILQKLAKDANPQVRLRAVDLLLSLKPTQAAPSAPQLPVDPPRLTPAERRRFEDLLKEFKALCEEVYTRDPHQRPDSTLPPTPEPTWDVDLASPTPEPAPTFVEPAPPVAEPEREPAPFRLAEHLWPDVGLFKLKGAVTHVLGDAHAQAILDGSIPYDTARQQHADDQRHNHATMHRR